MKVIKRLEGACLADHGFEKPNASSRSFLELAVVGDPSPPQTSAGIILGPGTDWDFLDSDRSLPARSLLGRQPPFCCLAPQRLGENMGMQREGFAHCFLTWPCLHPCRTQNWSQSHVRWKFGLRTGASRLARFNRSSCFHRVSVYLPALQGYCEDQMRERLDLFCKVQSTIPW